MQCLLFITHCTELLVFNYSCVLQPKRTCVAPSTAHGVFFVLGACLCLCERAVAWCLCVDQILCLIPVMMPIIDNAVINGLLCYVLSVRNSCDEQQILSVCQSFYSQEKIVDAKKTLFNLVKEPITSRRGEGKCRADLNDIFNCLCDLDERNVDLPKFVADTHSSMPPTLGYNVLAEHLIHLMEEMSSLKEQMK